MPSPSLKRIVPFLTRPLVLWSLALGLLAVLYAARIPDRPVKTEQKMVERVAVGKSIPVKYYTEVYWWKGALISLPLCLLLLALGKGVTRPLTAEFDPDSGRAPPGTAKWVALSALVAIALGAVLNSPRLSLGLWDDEEYVMRRYIVGSHERDSGTGTVEHKVPTWLDTMFDTRRPTNHTLYSTLARISHSFHKQGTGPHDLYFSEPLLRLPAFLSGLAALGAIAWCLFTFGFHRAAILAPFVLFAHAWFTRMGVDARGYSLVLFGAPASFAALALAVRTARARWRAAFVFFQFVCFFAFPGSLYLLVSLNLTALLLIRFRPGTSPRDRWSLLFRYAGATGIFALIGIFLFLPCVPQITEYMKGDRFVGEMDARWWQNLTGYLLGGTPWFDDEPTNPLSYDLAALIGDRFLLPLFAIAAIIATFLAGVWKIARSPQWPWLIALLATIPLLVAHNFLADRQPVHWYLVTALPGLIVVASVGATSFAARFKGETSHIAFALGALLLFGSVLGLANRMNHLLRTTSFVPLRESVAATKIEVTNPHHPEFDSPNSTITVGFHQPSLAYDPGVWWLSDPMSSGASFRNLLDKADAENRPLYVNFGLYTQALDAHPEIMALVTDPKIFQPVDIFYGLYGASVRHVHKYLPGSAR